MQNKLSIFKLDIHIISKITWIYLDFIQLNLMEHFICIGMYYKPFCNFIKNHSIKVWFDLYKFVQLIWESYLIKLN